MRMTTRRTALAGLGAAAAGTVAVATFLRKPAPFIAKPVVEPGPPTVHLAPISSLVVTDPPRPPTDIPITDAQGASHRLADFTGKGIVLNLWATWCVPCVAELPALAALAGQVQNDGIMVLPLSSDRGGAEVVRTFYDAHGLGILPIWLDPKGEAARAWGARGIPTTLIIDRQGRERGRLEGAADWASAASVQRIRELVG